MTLMTAQLNGPFFLKAVKSPLNGGFIDPAPAPGTTSMNRFCCISAKNLSRFMVYFWILCGIQ